MKGTQSKKYSLIESCASTFIGYIVAVTSQVLIFPIFNLQVPFTDTLLIGIWFTIISIIRSYIIRRIFNKW